MRDEVIRLSAIGQILRRRWRLLIVFAALGAVLGATVSLLWPPAYESSSRVLLQNDPDHARVLSEAQVAMSLVVLDRAAAELNWGVDGAGLRDSVTAAVVDGNVIELTVKADSPDRARQLAERVTEHYLAFSTEIIAKSATASGQLLGPRKDSLLKQIADINRRISELQGSVGLLNAANAQGAAARAELEQLSSNRTDTIKDLNDIDDQIATAQSQAAATSRQNFSVIEPPVAPRAAVPPTRLQLISGGAALATMLGALIAVAIKQADRRLRRSSDIAAALGAPVLGTMQAPIETATDGSSNQGNGDGVGRLPSLQRLLHNGTRLDTTAVAERSLEELRYRRVLGRLQRATVEPAKLLVVVVADDDVLASRAVSRLAILAAVDGAATLRLMSVSPARPTIPDSHDVSSVSVAVTSGTRTAPELLAIAEACHDAHYRVAGLLMVLASIDEDPAENFPERLSAAVGPPRGRAGRGPV